VFNTREIYLPLSAEKTKEIKDSLAPLQPLKSLPQPRFEASKPVHSITLNDQLNKKVPVKKYMPLFLERQFEDLSANQEAQFNQFLLTQGVCDIIYGF